MTTTSLEICCARACGGIAFQVGRPVNVLLRCLEINLLDWTVTTPEQVNNM